MPGFIDAIRPTLAELIGADETVAPIAPQGLPTDVETVVRKAIADLTAYQGPSYAQLYVDRISRFSRRPGIDAALLRKMAQLLAARMAYEDVGRLGQLALLRRGSDRTVEVRRLRLDEIVSAMPELIASPMLEVLDWTGWQHRTIKVRFSTASMMARQKRRLEASLKRWRPLSPRFARESASIERWLHMIDRALTKRPDAAMAVVSTADLIHGSGHGYRAGALAWRTIIDELVKPAVEGRLAVQNLPGAIAQVCAGAREGADPEQLRGMIHVLCRDREAVQP